MADRTPLHFCQTRPCPLCASEMPRVAVMGNLDGTTTIQLASGTAIRLTEAEVTSLREQLAVPCQQAVYRHYESKGRANAEAPYPLDEFGDEFDQVLWNEVLADSTRERIPASESNDG